ncbi:MAG: hypothetical protein P8Q90_06970 [Candidatus Thalassarchaeaceae archaeon]|nr:hypothetical protein [Candidatus Thalassarchaeaceae archaeon]
MNDFSTLENKTMFSTLENTHGSPLNWQPSMVQPLQHMWGWNDGN